MTEIYNTATTLLDVSPAPSSAEPRRSSFHNKRPSGWHRGHCQLGGMWGDSVEKITDLVKRGLAEAPRRSKQLSDFLFQDHSSSRVYFPPFVVRSCIPYDK